MRFHRHDPWRTATTLDDLATGTVDWLTGRVGSSPTYGGPPDPETAVIRDHLVAVNQVGGILTDSSQPGELGRRTRLTVRGRQVLRWRQRAYLAGFATTDRIDQLWNSLDGDEVVMLLRCPYRGPDGTGAANETPVPVTDGADGVHTWVGCWEPADEIAAVWGQSVPLAAVDALLHSWQFAVYDEEWGRNDLLWQVLAKALGIGEKKEQEAP